MLRWDATVPVTYGLTMQVRASFDGASWTGWGEAPQNPDLWQPADGPNAYWSQTIYAGEGAQFYQVRAVATAAPDGALPVLRSVQVDTVDARFGSAERKAQSAEQADADAAIAAVDAAMAQDGSALSALRSALSKPGVISRSGWNCPDGQGSRVRPVYYPVNHLVVHHTADANTLSGSEQNWGDRVRAEWSFHTFSRGWGDVGYNYLIAPNGQIYEGRSGGDDAVAFHDTGNYGSMGVVLIGTYATTQPPAAAQESLVGLLAWKADQKDIDPLGRSYYYGCAVSQYCKPYAPGAIVENIAGHRQVTPGHTSCPGDAALAILPSIRNQVRARMLGGTPTQPPPSDNGDLIIDELEAGFARSNATWYEMACGSGGHSFYTYATDRAAQSTNSATWRPTIPATGTYRVYAHVPQNCGLGTPPYASARASYRIRSASGDVTRTIDQNTAEEWVDLGSYSFSAGTDGAVELRDLTGEPYSQRKVIFFDSVKWV
ncbi:MAG: N-acetylmuramoyl-L-alanine amidase, partial [Chloroflexales bacterium]|nr:N-acetylmuramoyl-L-alanine amidase [Chloroflexales bacterium]